MDCPKNNEDSMRDRSVLIIDDNQEVSQVLKDELEEFGFVVDCAETGERGLEMVRQKVYSVLLLDMIMPGINGYEVLRELSTSNQKQEPGIIVITAKRGGEITEAVLGFGADDVLKKPISTEELVARIKKVIREKNRTVRRRDGEEGLVVDEMRCEIRCDGKTVNLRPSEYKILKILIENEGVVLSRNRLNELLGKENTTERTVDSHIKHIRRKLGEKGKAIKTVPSFGYRYCIE